MKNDVGVAAVGIACLVLGAIFLFFPDLASGILTIVIGIGLLYTGFINIRQWFTLRGDEKGRSKVSLISGVVAVLIGIYAIFHPFVTADMVYLLVAGCVVVMGLCTVINALNNTEWGALPRALRLIAGVIVVILGIIVIVFPNLIFRLIGIALLVAGLMDLVIGGFLRPQNAENQYRRN